LEASEAARMTEQMYREELSRSAMSASQWIKSTSIYKDRQVCFDRPTNSDGDNHKAVCRKHRRWVVGGRTIEPGDPAESNSQPIFTDRPLDWSCVIS